MLEELGVRGGSLWTSAFVKSASTRETAEEVVPTPCGRCRRPGAGATGRLPGGGDLVARVPGGSELWTHPSPPYCDPLCLPAGCLWGVRHSQRAEGCDTPHTLLTAGHPAGKLRPAHWHRQLSTGPATCHPGAPCDSLPRASSLESSNRGGVGNTRREVTPRGPRASARRPGAGLRHASKAGKGPPACRRS